MAAGAQVISVAATTAGVLLCGANSNNIQTVLVQITGTLTTVSITFKGRITQDASLTNTNNVTLGYTTPASSAVATTAIAAVGAFWVRSDGMDVYADVTVTAGGPVVFHVMPLNG